VIGATGGVGTTLLRALKAARTTLSPAPRGRVIATAEPGDEDVLRGLGADEVTAYDAYPGDLDMVINLVLPTDQLREAAKALKPGGRLYTITFPAPKPEYIDRDDVTFEMVLDMTSGVEHVTGLTPTVMKRYPFSEGPRALQDFAREHTLGKLVVVA
jgi:NADPH:quinone reductase-like Zn-dependent oxidoreductase